MQKLGLVISDGVGYRNFVLSDFMNQAKNTFEEVVIFSYLPKVCFPKNYIVVELQAIDEKFPTWFFRKAKELAHLQLHKNENFGILDNLNANYTKINNPRGFGTRLLFRFTKFFHSEKWISRYNNWQVKTLEKNQITKNYKTILETQKVDFLFFTHQRPPFIAPFLFAAKKLKIKTGTFIFSWDNLASKGRMSGDFDNYFVWSDLMKKELLQFYSKINPETIKIVGTPQFEPYIMDQYKISKQDFFKIFDLNSNLKTICFSCGDISTSKNDELYIETIANFIIEKKIPEVNFLIRTSPAEDPKRFYFLKDKFNFIKWNEPKWQLSREGHQEAWSQRIPTQDDVKDLRSILEYSDLNINMLSTMSLDFMLFDKPVINPVFGNETNGLYNDQRFLKYKHIENFVDTKASVIVKNQNELLKAINLYLENPFSNQAERKLLVDLEISKELSGTSSRIIESIKSII